MAAAFFGMFSKKKDQQKKPLSSPSSVSAIPRAATITGLGGARSSTAAKGSLRVSTAMILRPHITEKSTQANARSSYTFLIRRDATKAQVARAMHALYGVAPTKVNIIVGADRVRRTKFGAHRRLGDKKAIVTFPKATQIDVSKAPHSL